MGVPALLILGVALAVGLLVVLLVARIGYLGEIRWRLANLSEPAEVIDLRGLDEWEAAFNEDIGTPRLVLLLSPT